MIYYRGEVLFFLEANFVKDIGDFKSSIYHAILSNRNILLTVFFLSLL